MISSNDGIDMSEKSSVRPAVSFDASSRASDPVDLYDNNGDLIEDETRSSDSEEEDENSEKYKYDGKDGMMRGIGRGDDIDSMNKNDNKIDNNSNNNSNSNSKNNNNDKDGIENEEDNDENEIDDNNDNDDDENCKDVSGIFSVASVGPSTHRNALHEKILNDDDDNDILNENSNKNENLLENDNENENELDGDNDQLFTASLDAVEINFNDQIKFMDLNIQAMNEEGTLIYIFFLLFYVYTPLFFCFLLFSSPLID